MKLGQLERLRDQNEILRAELARVTAGREQASEACFAAREQRDEWKAMALQEQVRREEAQAERDQAQVTARYATEALANAEAQREEARVEREAALDKHADMAVKYVAAVQQRDQALRLMRGYALGHRNNNVGWWALYDWALRASDPSKPWPTDQETQEILDGR